MSIITTTADSGADSVFSIERLFAKDELGRTLFYPMGRANRGYLVTDPARESALRVAAKEQMAASKMIGGVLATLSAVATSAFLRHFVFSSPLTSCAALYLCFGACMQMVRLRWHVCAGNLLSDLPRVPPQKHGYYRFIFGAWAFLPLAWIVRKLYELRLENLVSNDGVSRFYSDIVPIVIFTAIATTLAVLFGLYARKVRTGKTVTIFLIFLVNAFAFLGATAVKFIKPTPSIAFDKTGFVCGRRVLWAHITNIEPVPGLFGSDKLRLEIEPTKIYWRPAKRKKIDCQISGLMQDYDTVYQAITTAWQNSIQAPRAR